MWWEKDEVLMKGNLPKELPPRKEGKGSVHPDGLGHLPFKG